MTWAGDAGPRGFEADSYPERPAPRPGVRVPAERRAAERMTVAGAEVSPVRLAACVALLELYRRAYDDTSGRMQACKPHSRSYRAVADERGRLMQAMNDALEQMRGLMRGLGARLRTAGAGSDAVAVAVQDVMHNTLRVVPVADPSDARALARDAERWALDGFDLVAPARRGRP